MQLTQNQGISRQAGAILDANFTRLGHQTLTDAATIAFNVALGHNAKVTLTDNRTMGAPTNALPGDSGKLVFIQDGDGSRLITWNAAWKHAAGTDLVLSTAANSIDVIDWYTADGTTFLITSATKAMAT